MNVYLVLAIATLFYFIIPFMVIVFIKNRKICTFFMVTLFLMFLVVLFVGIYFKVSFINNMVYAVPDFSGEWFDKTINLSFANISTFDLVINLVMLIPVGVFCRYATRNKFIGSRILILLLVAVISGVLTELGQFILPVPRSVQLSDSLLNMVSVLIGGFVGVICFSVRKNKNKRRRK